MIACAVDGPRRAFGIQRGEETFHRRVVPAVAGTAHAMCRALVHQEPLERLAGVLAASIGVMQYGLGFASPPDGHHQRIGDPLCRHRRLHGPAHHSLGKEIDHRCDVEPPFGRPEIGEVRHPFPVRNQLGLELGHIAPEAFNLQLIGFHLPLAGERLLSIDRLLPYPAP